MALSVVFLQSEIDKSKYQEISLLEVWTTELCCKYQGLKFDSNGNVSKLKLLYLEIGILCQSLT